MSVYNPDGTLIGTIQDIELPVGGGEIGLQILSKFNTIERVSWSMVAAAGDIVILKEKVELKQPEQPPTAPIYTPTVTTPPQPQQRGGIFTAVTSKLPLGKKEKAVCPTCGRELSWIEQYQRWYCYNCGKYV